MKKLMILVFLLVNSAFLHAADFQEGVHYKKLPAQQTSSGDKIEVLEFFWYGCPHCYSFEPYINAWKKTKPANIEVVRVPAIFRPEWEVQARAYYALSNMGVIEDIHGEIFSAIHNDKKRLDTKARIADFVEGKGVDRKKFLEEYDSFAVNSMVRKAKKKVKAFQLEGVPSVVVNGKYLISGSMAGSFDNMIKIAEYLAVKESNSTTMD